MRQHCWGVPSLCCGIGVGGASNRLWFAWGVVAQCVREVVWSALRVCDLGKFGGALVA